MSYHYRVHGLALASELELPELAPCALSGAPPDVWVRLASLPTFADARSTPIPYLHIVDDAVLFDVETVARYLVRAGREVTIDIRADADPSVLRLFLFGSVMGAICLQRGLLALHASAVAFGDRVVAFTGQEGAGKSTMAAHCLAAGGQLLADDIVVVSLDQRGGAVANPGMPRVKLWRDALTTLGRGSDGLTPDWFRADKFHLPVEHATRPLPLERLYVLDIDDAAGPGQFTRLTGARAADAIIANTYRIEYIDVVGRRELHFQQCVRLAQTIEVVRLARRRNSDYLQSTAALVAAHFDIGSGGMGDGRAAG